MAKKREPMEFRCRTHPSGRPLDQRNVYERRVWRIPDDGFVTPRLRTPQRDLRLIGFTHRFEGDGEDE